MDKILLVDDNLNTLSAYQRLAHKKFRLMTAESGKKGLTIIEKQGPFAVVVSDFRMPEMDGIQFLSRVREMAPDTVRVMLTGQADLQASIDAINEGNIFRFLTKPCPPDIFHRTLKAAIDQYRLITAERELLEETLKGSIKLLIDIISIVNPTAFSHSSRLRSMVRRVADRLKVVRLWEIELAAMLSQIGCVTIPGQILEKKYLGETLSNDEHEMFLDHPRIGQRLLSNIPRLERIAEAIGYQLKQFDGGGFPDNNTKGNSIPLISRILKVVFDFDALVQAGKTELESLAIMHAHENRYDPRVLSALEAEVMAAIEAEAADPKEQFKVKTIDVKHILTGMVLADDVKDGKGRMLISQGYEITDVLKTRLLNFVRLGVVIEPVQVWERIEDSNTEDDLAKKKKGIICE